MARRSLGKFVRLHELPAGPSRTLRVRTSRHIGTQADRLPGPVVTDVDGNSESDTVSISLIDAIERAQFLFFELMFKYRVPQERIFEAFFNKHRRELDEDVDPGDRALFVTLALLSAACASGRVQTFVYYAPGKHKPIPPEYWQDVELTWSWKGFTENIRINEPDLSEWFTERFLRPGRRGRKPKVDWDGIVKRRLFELLDYHGWPEISDPKWSTQADVESAVAEICGVPLSESTVRAHTTRLMSEWLRKKTGK